MAAPSVKVQEKSSTDEGNAILTHFEVNDKPLGKQKKNTSKKKDESEDHWFDDDKLRLLTKDARKISVSKRMLFAESHFFRTLLEGRFAVDVKKRIPVDVSYNGLKQCVRYIKALENKEKPKPNMQDAFDIFQAASYLTMESVLESIANYISTNIDNSNLVAGYRMACQLYVPLAKHLWRKIILRFRYLSQNSDYLKLDDNEMNTALNDEKLNVFAAEENDMIELWTTTKKNEKKETPKVSECPRITVSNHDQSKKFTVVKQRLPSSLIVSFGGFTTPAQGLIFMPLREITGQVEFYSERANAWTRAAQQYQCDPPVTYHGTAIVKKKMLLYGGYRMSEFFQTCRTFDLTTGEWGNTRNMLDTRCYVGSTEFTDANGIDYALALGGYNTKEYLSTCEMYNSDTEFWTPLPNMNFKRSEFGATMVGSKIFAVGGGYNHEVFGHHEMFDFGAQKWYVFEKKDMKFARKGHQVVTHDRNCVIVLGGQSGNRRMKSVEFFDIREGIWQPLRSFCSVRTHAAATMLNEHIYLTGGDTGLEAVTTTERYDIRTNRWEELAPMNSRRVAHRLVHFDNVDVIKRLTSYVEDENNVDYPDYLVPSQPHSKAQTHADVTPSNSPT